MNPLAVVFWIWVLVSLVILVRRFLGRRSTRVVGATTARAAGAPSTTPPGDTERADAPQPHEPRAEAVPEPAPRPVAADPAPPAEPTGPFDKRPATLAEALEGISMPCDLVPITHQAAHHMEPNRASLATDQAGVDTVVAALAAELHRLGYGVDAGDHRLLAERDGTAVAASVTERITGDAPGVVVELTVS